MVRVKNIRQNLSSQFGSSTEMLANGYSSPNESRNPKLLYDKINAFIRQIPFLRAIVTGLSCIFVLIFTFTIGSLNVYNYFFFMFYQMDSSFISHLPLSIYDLTSSFQENHYKESLHLYTIHHTNIR